MNFFQHQDKARRQTRRLVFLFILAVIVIIVAIDAVLLFAVGISQLDDGQALSLGPELFTKNLALLGGGAIVTGSVIGVASLFRTMLLRGGGGKVARDLGGTLVDADTRDPLRRRLRNIVEEIAIASGIPVPEIYLLEKESGINAFAAGYSPSDAAIAVTRGALEKLNRSELQGVIAHEFSHVFNGDMRLNIRLMGALFGILMLAIIGRKVLHNAAYMGRSSKNNAPVFVIALAVMMVGYTGLFFGRWIKAAVSRQREFLADASAVQYTRDPDGISGALKKIAVYSEASYLDADTEEVGHMLFGTGQRMHMFATHPPLEQRIQRIEPRFRSEELKDLAERLKRKTVREARQAEREEKQRDSAASGRGMDFGNIVDRIGNPEFERILMAAAVAASIPNPVREAARSNEWAPEVLFLTLLDPDTEIREQQLLIISQRMGSDSEEQVRGLLTAQKQVQPEQRLPLLEVAFPALKRRPPDFVKTFLQTVQELVDVDGRVDVFEYLLAKVISQHLWESMNPRSVNMSGSKKLTGMTGHVATVLAVLSTHSSDDSGDIENAYTAGWKELGMDAPAMPDARDWITLLDAALPQLDRLRIGDKQRLVSALVNTVTADEKVIPEELELLRAVCSMLHVPLPIMASPAEQPV